MTDQSSTPPKRRHWILKTIIVIVVVLVALVAGAFFFIDSLAKKAITAGGTYALGVQTTLDSADVGVFAGTFSMSGLAVANPPGFDRASFLELEHGGVDVSLGSLAGDTVHLPSLELSGMEVHLDKKGGKANYQVILDNLSKFEIAPREDAKKYIIDEIVLRDVNVRVEVLPLGGNATKVTVPIIELRLKNVGTDSNKGVLMGEVVGAVLKSVLLTAIQNGGGLIPSDVGKELTGALSKLQDLGGMGIEVAGQVVGEASKVVEDVGEKAKDVVEGAAEGIKGILPGQKKKKDDGGGG